MELEHFAPGAKKRLRAKCFVIQSIFMESNWAAEHLQVIRTLMERSSIYRRALAPVMIYTGAVGLVGAIVGWKLQLGKAIPFVGFWYAVGCIAIAGAFLLTRRQALKKAEVFWSPPTRRVAQAMLPALTAGFILGLLVALAARPGSPEPPPAGWTLVALPVLWIVLYGCAMHAAGFFMPRGMKLFGWAFVLGGFVVAWVLPHHSLDGLLLTGYALMGGFFGVLHLAYGTYLYFTEPRGNEA